MAKRTKINANLNATADTAATTVPVTSGATSSTSEVTTNSSISAKNEVTHDVPSKSSEYERFTILKDNIIKQDDYIKFIELANKYITPNVTDLNNLHKQDLICLIGYTLDKFYLKSEAYNKLVAENNAKNRSSFDCNPNYSGLLDNVGMYKGWN